MKKILPVLALILVLTGCTPPPQSGFIIAKDYDESRLYQCSVKPLIFCTDDEDWDLLIRNGEHEGWVGVTPDTYEAYNVGDFIDFRRAS